MMPWQNHDAVSKTRFEFHTRTWGKVSVDRDYQRYRTYLPTSLAKEVFSHAKWKETLVRSKIRLTSSNRRIIHSISWPDIKHKWNIHLDPTFHIGTNNLHIEYGPIFYKSLQDAQDEMVKDLSIAMAYSLQGGENQTIHDGLAQSKQNLAFVLRNQIYAPVPLNE